MATKHPFILEVAAELALPKAILSALTKEMGSEVARNCAMSTSVGGIGPLMRDRLNGQSENAVDAIGVSLLYENVWVQTWETPENLTLKKVPVGDYLRKILTPSDIKFSLELFNGKAYEISVFTGPFEKGTGYFLCCPELTDVIYPGEVDAPGGTKDPGYWAHEIRLKQSWLLGRGALQLVKSLGKKPDLTVMSETAAIMAHHKLFDDTFTNDNFFSSTRYIFNDHTPLEYAHPQWDQNTLNLVKVNPSLVSESSAWNDKTKHLDVTGFSVENCEGVYGVSRKHGDVMRQMPSLKKFSSKIESITNGIRIADWQNTQLSTEKANLNDNELLTIREGKKQDLLVWLDQNTPGQTHYRKIAQNKKIVLLTRRITSYKRVDIVGDLLKNAELREEFLKLEILLIIGGRIHQQDKPAQETADGLIKLINSQPKLKECVVFLDNYNIAEAPLLFQGSDAALMISDEAKEASSTGFMKSLANGGIVIATKDGAVPEFVEFWKTPKNGCLIPYIDGHPTSKGLLRGLQEFNTLFSDSKMKSDMIRASLAKTKSISIKRTVSELKDFYEKILRKEPASL